MAALHARHMQIEFAVNFFVTYFQAAAEKHTQSAHSNTARG